MRNANGCSVGRPALHLQLDTARFAKSSGAAHFSPRLDISEWGALKNCMFSFPKDDPILGFFKPARLLRSFRWGSGLFWS